MSSEQIGWFLEFYVLAISKVISGEVSTCDSAHSWGIYNAASQGDQALARSLDMPHTHIILTLRQPVLDLA